MNTIDQRFRKLAGLLGQHTSVLIQACDYIGMKSCRATKLESLDITGWRSLLLTLMTGLRFFFFLRKQIQVIGSLLVRRPLVRSFLMVIAGDAGRDSRKSRQKEQSLPQT